MFDSYEIRAYSRRSLLDDMGEPEIGDAINFTTAFLIAGEFISRGATDVEIVRMPAETPVWAAGFLKFDINEHNYRMRDYYDSLMENK